MFDPRQLWDIFSQHADQHTQLIAVSELPRALEHHCDEKVLEFVVKELNIANFLSLAQFLHVAFVAITSNLDDKEQLYFKLKDGEFRHEINIQQFDDILERFGVHLAEDDLRLIVSELSDCSNGNISYELYLELLSQFLFE